MGAAGIGWVLADTIEVMWEERYATSDDYMFGKAPAIVLSDNPWIVDGAKSALCVADGEGRNSVFLAERGMAVTSFDLSRTAIERTNSLAATAGVKVDAHVSEWSGWDWSEQFDLVVAIFVQFTGADLRPQQFADLRAAVRPGGRLLVHGFTPKQLEFGTGGPPVVENLYTEEILRDAFGDWNIRRLASYELEQDSGLRHVGHAALIDIVVDRPS